MMSEKLIIMVVGENPCFYNDRLFDNAKIIARLYTRNGKWNQVLECLEKTQTILRKFPTRIRCEKLAMLKTF